MKTNAGHFSCMKPGSSSSLQNDATITSYQAILTFLIQCTGHLPVWACLVSKCFPHSIQGLLLHQLYFKCCFSYEPDSWLSDAELVCSQQLASNNRTQELHQKSRGVNQRSSPHPSRSWTQILMGHQTGLSELRTRCPPLQNPCLGRRLVPCVWMGVPDGRFLTPPKCWVHQTVSWWLGCDVSSQLVLYILGMCISITEMRCASRYIIIINFI